MTLDKKLLYIGLCILALCFLPFLGKAQTSPSTSAMSAASSSPVSLGRVTASKVLVRIDQHDPNQYNSYQEYETWWYSACSPAAIAEVMNAYGHNYRLADVLNVERDLHEITADAGLLHPSGIDRTAAHFRFSVHWLYHPSVNDLVATANSGTPVVINFPPSRYRGGHFLVVRGGSRDYVYLADSSTLDMRALDRKTFLRYWVGFAVVIIPA